MKKIDTYASLRPAQATGSALDALSQLSNQVTDTAFKLGANIRQKQGKIEGAEAGRVAAETGVAPKQKQSLFPTIYGDSFNDSQKAAYLASTDRQAVERMVEIENEFAMDAEGYEASTKGLVDGILKNAPIEYKEPLAQSMQNYISRGRMRVNENILQQGRKEAESELLGALDTYTREASRVARNGDSEAVIENLEKIKLSGQALVDSGAWTKEQASEALRVARNETTEQAYLQIVDDMPISEATKAIDDAEKNVMEGFSGDEHDAMIARARVRLQKRITEESRDAAKGQGAIYRNMEADLRRAIRIGEGDPDQLIEDLNFLYQKEVFTPQQYAGLFGTIHDDLRGKQKVWQRIETGDASVMVEPASIEKVYKQEYLEADPAAQVDFVQKVNHIPDLMKRKVTNDLYAGDIQLAAEAADTIARLSEVRGLPETFPIKDKAYATQLKNLMSLYEPEKAIDIARKNTDPRDQARIEFRQSELEDKKRFTSDDWKDGANDALGSFFKSLDAISMPVVAKDYETAFKQYYIAGMDEGDAKKAAEDDLKRVYSKWNGRPMKHSPEKYYSVNGDTDWIDTDLKRELSASIAGAPSIDDYYFISDDRTSREAAKGVPSYFVRYKSGDRWETLIGRYQPDIEAARNKKMDESKGEIDRLRNKGRIDTKVGVTIPAIGGI